MVSHPQWRATTAFEPLAILRTVSVVHNVPALCEPLETFARRLPEHIHWAEEHRLRIDATDAPEPVIVGYRQ